MTGVGSKPETLGHQPGATSSQPDKSEKDGISYDHVDRNSEYQ